MSKMIKLTEELLNKYTDEFREALLNGKFADGKVSFTKTLNTSARKATVRFAEMAWLKMQGLVREFEKEVAWHGLATRCDEADTYLISDILIYPQEVTGATVTTDQDKYQMWLMNHDDDVFNNIRMQGHSHVNMSTSPSGVDLSLYERILDQLDDDMFYIFMIWNKRGEKNIKIYDMRENVLFETADVTVEIIEDEVTKFLKDAKEMVVDKPKVTYASTTPGYKGVTYKSEKASTTSNAAKASEQKKKGKRKKESSPYSYDYDYDYDDGLSYYDNLYSRFYR